MNTITIIGLGPGDPNDLSMGSLERLKSARNVYLRTEHHPVVAHLKVLGINYRTFDWVYEEYQDFQEVYERIAHELLSLAKEKEEVVYAVPGNPLVAEESVERLLRVQDPDLNIDILPAISFIDAIIHALRIDPIHGLKILDALQLSTQSCDPRMGNIIAQVYSPLVASDVKLRLMELYKDDTIIWVIRAAGVKGEERVQRLPLYELDRLNWIDHLTSIYIPPIQMEDRSDGQLDRLLDIMATLRSEEGCPWDREQNHHSLREHLIEEAYEVLDAIQRNDMVDLEEELGDLLLQIVFHAQIAGENGQFNFSDVVRGICDKLIHRHPHIFSNTRVSSSHEVMTNWEALKKVEKGMTTQSQVLKAIPSSLPALMRAYKVQKKAADVGFDWDDIEGALSKVKEEWEEFLKAHGEEEQERIVEELGDLLFSIVNVSRFLKIQPELALGQTIEKFLRRFSYMEESSHKLGKKLEEMTLEELDELWNQSKVHIFKKNDKNYG